MDIETRNDRAPGTDVPETTAEQAASWWVLLNESNADPADHRAFGEWVAQSPERVAAFLNTARLSRALQSQQIRWPNERIEDLLKEAREAQSTGVIYLSSARKGQPSGGARVDTRRSTRRKVAVAGLAAAAAAVLTVVGLRSNLLQPTRFQTEIGEQRSLVLSDGSVVTLNTASSIEVHMTSKTRTIRLRKGEALFQVARDIDRPFDVATGNTTVRALGTEFNVNQRQTGTTVTVIEGRVAVNDSALRNTAATLLNGGDEATVTRLALTRRSSPNPAAAIAWTQRKLVFDHETLGAVAEEFNRYNRRTIHIDSDALREQQVTGVFQANELDSFVTFLAHLPGVTVRVTPDGSRISVESAPLDAGTAAPQVF